MRPTKFGVRRRRRRSRRRLLWLVGSVAFCLVAAAATIGIAVAAKSRIPPPAPPPAPRISVTGRCVTPTSSSGRLPGRIAVSGRHFPAGAKVLLDTKDGFSTFVIANNRGAFETSRLKAPMRPLGFDYRARLVSASASPDGGNTFVMATSAYILASSRVCEAMSRAAS